MFIGIERLTCLQTLPHFVVSRDANCRVGQLGELKFLRGKLELYGLSDIENMEEASKASLCTKSNVERLKLVWNNNENEVDNDKDVMEGLIPHTNLKELKILYFKGKKMASWITKMTNLVKITINDCNRCQEIPPLGHLPKLREMEIKGMDNAKIIRCDICRGLRSSTSDLNDSLAANTITTIYPSLTNLTLWNLPKLEEWQEPLVSTDQSTVLVFPKLEVLEIVSCSKLRRIPSSSFPSLKKLIIRHNSLILGMISRKVSSLTDLHLKNISVRGCGFSSFFSNMDSAIDKLLKNNSMSLTILNLNDCRGLTRLTLGVAIQGLRVVNCRDLTSINVVEDSVNLKYLMIASCPSLSEWSFVQSMRSTLVRLSLGHLSEDSNEFPWPFSSSSSSSISFPNLTRLALIGWEKVESIMPAGEVEDRFSSAFPCLTHLNIRDFEGLKALPDSIAKLPSLEGLHIWNCKTLRSLPTFEKSHSLRFLEMNGCPILKQRYMKGSGPEWFKIKHISDIIWVLPTFLPVEYQCTIMKISFDKQTVEYI
ncbi:hypothetical protein POM88_040036 [Heracleum sosnowskyi]|uniref:R13L1/DRL21-like LRR repeat region domain-containing protein n=1 Tax=Heracleum sosnowskyi TaxID=360622 RepID=A0AAD8HBH1_9APIA|nr:hypothetical protein POM88_040036 [Heracleum sosnowskyi]